MMIPFRFAVALGALALLVWFQAATTAYSDAAAPTAAAEATPDMVLVVDRMPGAVEIYVAMDADRMLQTFGLPQDRLAGPGGSVDFAPLRQGTYDMADEMFAVTAATIGGAPARFEAMSMMVHPQDEALPMRTPLEGLIAIGVCTVPEPDRPPRLDALRAYAGFIAYTDTPQAPLALRFPAVADGAPGGGALTVEIREHTEGRETAVTRMTLGAERRVVTAPGSSAHTALLAGGAGLLGALGAGALWMRRRQSAAADLGPRA